MALNLCCLKPAVINLWWPICLYIGFCHLGSVNSKIFLRNRDNLLCLVLIWYYVYIVFATLDIIHISHPSSSHIVVGHIQLQHQVICAANIDLFTLHVLTLTPGIYGIIGVATSINFVIAFMFANVAASICLPLCLLLGRRGARGNQ